MINPALSIDEVLSQLQAIISESERVGDRNGFFAALYFKVTSAVKQGIVSNQFEDGPRMEKLDVLFANRYLAAYDAWKNDRPLSACWAVAFGASKKRSFLFLQHLLLGMNAHINLDLGIAAVDLIRSEPGLPPIQKIQNDFNSINAIIGSLIYEMTNDIDRVSPLMSLLGLHADNTEALLVQFSITNARDGAWCFAEDLAKNTGASYETFIQARDGDIAKLASALIISKGMIGMTMWIIHLFEWKNPARIIKALYESKRTFVKAASLGNAAG